MLSPDRIADSGAAREAAADYDVVRRAIAYIREHWREQPEIEAIAHAAGVTPTELHHLFRRWAGLTPEGLPAGDHARQRAASCCAIPQACSTPPTRSASPAPAGCTTCSSPTRRCRRANGSPAARA